MHSKRGNNRARQRERGIERESERGKETEKEKIKSNNIYYWINALVYVKHTHKNNDNRN